MTAIEAALLRRLLHDHGQPVEAIRAGAQARSDTAGLVLCCHGARAAEGRGHFDSELRLGDSPLSVGRIAQWPQGPALALLPACHAGETLEDSAGNALGLAAGFLLAGSRTVVASAKAVPDALIPWFTTLALWHRMQGLGARQAAILARNQFARMAFPEDFRAWLQAALPEALATLQRRGSEYPAIEGNGSAQAALHAMVKAWPWQGASADLFGSHIASREAAMRTVAEGILRPEPQDAETLHALMHATASFIFVYGCD
jgi:hypothetical protein